MTLQPVILSGGSGTRLWPLSREHYPKQLLALFGDFTLLQATAGRIQRLAESGDKDGISVQPPVVVCSEEHRFMVAEQLREGSHVPAGIILEPAGRNTAPAATLAALRIAAINPDSVMLVMPADHVILDVDAFRCAVLEGAALASQGYIVTFGIVPVRPETGYGYIRKGAELEMSAPRASSAAPPCLVGRFVEKPDIETARNYLESGGYLWNSGLFMMKAGVWLAAVGRFAPEILAACTRAHEQGMPDGDFFRIDKEAFGACPSDSIDYAVMEKLMQADSAGHVSGDLPLQAAVVPLDAGWSDVGAWSSLWDVLSPDADGNILKGDVIVEDAHDSLIFSDYRLIAGIGIQDIIVIETADAVLVVHKDKAQAVKQVVARLKQAGRGEHQLHRRVHRPWGSYEGIDRGERFQVKRIIVRPGASLSLQMHHHRAEHWVVVCGTAKVVKGDEVFLLSENESTYIPIGVRHRLENPGTLPLEIIEIQSGSYLGEDDIVRFEDHYGRK